MKESKSLKVSVRDLVEFVLRTGDIDSGFTMSSRALEGTRVHQLIQKSAGDNYNAEITITYTIEVDEMSLEIKGRIDGVIKNEDYVTIDEIKSTYQDLSFIDENYNILHMAQVKCYAYIYAIQNNQSFIEVQLTYYQIDTKEIKYIKKQFRIEELEVFFNNLIQGYIRWAKIMRNWNLVRDESITKLEFPFKTYRKGQRELAVGVYRTIKDEKKLFIQAPTGIGKTIATIFPSLKAMAEGYNAKIFYLTAKTITRTIAEKAFDNLREQGLRVKTLTITAKDKVCFKPESSCNPEECEYAKGFFDRVNEAVEDIYKEDALSRNIIEKYAKKHKICPFEFTLNLSLWSDCIICDYNYVFDPRVYLKRFFMDVRDDYTLLIDEAHNLVDRSREMFSAYLSKNNFLELKKGFKIDIPKLSKNINKIDKFMLEQRKKCDEVVNGYIVIKEPPSDIYSLLRDFMKISEVWLAQNEPHLLRDKLLDLYFKVNAFLRTSEYFDERYVTYIYSRDRDLILKIFCLDPSFLLKEAMKRGKSAMLFSATLSPMDYFIKILGGDENSSKLTLPSPFPEGNLSLLIDDKTSTKYKMRESTYGSVSDSILEVSLGKIGNYLVFFPSYKYMNEVYKIFCEKNSSIKTICQSSNMNEEEKEGFLKEFYIENSKTMVAFAVMGGMFGEGIDLTGELLSGAIIVGVGLPQIGLERDIIRKYFDESNGTGYEYAYMYPGMNKVMQAMGRVIRTEKDRGVVLLIDERFSSSSYRRLFPPEWSSIIYLGKQKQIHSIIKDFWSR